MRNNAKKIQKKNSKFKKKKNAKQKKNAKKMQNFLDYQIITEDY